VKSKQLISIVGAMFLTGLLLSPVAFGIGAFGRDSTAMTPQGANVYKLKEAGIQFEVPAGWEVETIGGTFVLKKKEQDNNFMLATIAEMPPSESLDDSFKEYWTAFAVNNGDKDFKDVKPAGEVEKTAQNGFALIRQPFTATDHGTPVIGTLTVLKGGVPVQIISYTSAKSTDALGKEVEKLMGSIKKSQ
jgi:hypothetical protein